MWTHRGLLWRLLLVAAVSTSVAVRAQVRAAGGLSNLKTVQAAALTTAVPTNGPEASGPYRETAVHVVAEISDAVFASKRMALLCESYMNQMDFVFVVTDSMDAFVPGSPAHATCSPRIRVLKTGMPNLSESKVAAQLRRAWVIDTYLEVVGRLGADPVEPLAKSSGETYSTWVVMTEFDAWWEPRMLREYVNFLEEQRNRRGGLVVGGAGSGRLWKSSEEQANWASFMTEEGYNRVAFPYGAMSVVSLSDMRSVFGTSRGGAVACQTDLINTCFVEDSRSSDSAADMYRCDDSSKSIGCEVICRAAPFRYAGAAFNNDHAFIACIADAAEKSSRKINALWARTSGDQVYFSIDKFIFQYNFDDSRKETQVPMSLRWNNYVGAHHVKDTWLETISSDTVTEASPWPTVFLLENEASGIQDFVTMSAEFHLCDTISSGAFDHDVMVNSVNSCRRYLETSTDISFFDNHLKATLPLGIQAASKFLIALREPISMAEMHYKQACPGEPASETLCSDKNLFLEDRKKLSLFFYKANLERWFGTFNRARFLVLQVESLAESVGAIYEFLDSTVRTPALETSESLHGIRKPEALDAFDCSLRLKFAMDIAPQIAGVPLLVRTRNGVYGEPPAAQTRAVWKAWRVPLCDSAPSYEVLAGKGSGTEYGSLVRGPTTTPYDPLGFQQHAAADEATDFDPFGFPQRAEERYEAVEQRSASSDPLGFPRRPGTFAEWVAEKSPPTPWDIEFKTVQRELSTYSYQYADPSPLPTSTPAFSPTSVPTRRPTAVPLAKPTAVPSPLPTRRPTGVPLSKPTAVPSLLPTRRPTGVPLSKPTAVPSPPPTVLPTTPRPSVVPSARPTPLPTLPPSGAPTLSPSRAPTRLPSAPPSLMPSELPTLSTLPTAKPSPPPTPVPTAYSVDLVGAESTALESPYGIAYDSMRGYVFATGGPNMNGVAVIDANNAAQPKVLGTFIDTKGYLTYPTGIATTDGKLAYVSGLTSNSMVILQMTDPTNIKLRGSYSSSEYLLGPIGIVHDMANNFVYVAAHTAYTAGGRVTILDVENSDAPTYVGSAAYSSDSFYPRNIAYDAARAYLYVADADPIAPYLLEVDIKLPKTPKLTRNYDVSTYLSVLKGVVYDSTRDYCFITGEPSSNYYGALVVVSTLETDLKVIGSYTSTSATDNLGKVGDAIDYDETRSYVFLGSYDKATITVIDAVDATQPRLIGSVTDSASLGLVNALVFDGIGHGGYVWVASSGVGKVVAADVQKATSYPTSVPTTPAPSTPPTPTPTKWPTEVPTGEPSLVPTLLPTSLPSLRPTHVPSREPSPTPTKVPSRPPTKIPSHVPTSTPTGRPSALPTLQPSAAPSLRPTAPPSSVPTALPSLDPTPSPTAEPSKLPTATPSRAPTPEPSTEPTAYPSIGPSSQPTRMPTLGPTRLPTSTPTLEPTSLPSRAPSLAPTSLPSRTPTQEPTSMPSLEPTLQPTASPSLEPTPGPSDEPTLSPTRRPTRGPTSMPSLAPSSEPTALPSAQPSSVPTSEPTSNPSHVPTREPTLGPTWLPSLVPTALPSLEPTAMPSHLPTLDPTLLPSQAPTAMPSLEPTPTPTLEPTFVPSRAPTAVPTIHPTGTPTMGPTGLPTIEPTGLPTLEPSALPTFEPTSLPSLAPSLGPTALPSLSPSAVPTLVPTSLPSSLPTGLPSLEPTLVPTSLPSSLPTGLPSLEPTLVPTSLPSSLPTGLPSLEPTSLPTQEPTAIPTSLPTPIPSSVPTAVPSLAPSLMPTLEPSSFPTSPPSLEPTAVPSMEPSPLPTTLPTPEPSPLPTTARPTVEKGKPTALPTLSAPVIEGLAVTTTGVVTSKYHTIFNPSAKLTLLAEWTSPDTTNTLEWSSDDLVLVHGDTTATTLAGNFLVINPVGSTGAATFMGGSVYSLTFRATNSFGRYDYDTISIKAASLPANGNFTVSPKNGTAMTSGFTLATSDWTSDAEVLPLSFAFAYTSATTGGRTVLKKASRVTNFTTTLPVGNSENEYKLDVSARIKDQIGAYADVFTSVTVKSPPTHQSNSIVSSLLTSVDPTTMSSDDVVDVASSLASAASLLNHGLSLLSSSSSTASSDDSTTSGSGSSSGSDDGGAAAAEAANAESRAEASRLRESLVSTMSKVVSVVSDPDGVESSLSTLRVVTSASPESLSSDAQVSVLGCVGDLMDTSTSLGSTSDDAAQSSMSTISNLFEGGLLSSPINPSSLPTPLPSSPPTSLPTVHPTISSKPSSLPTPPPTFVPTMVPTPLPSIVPTLIPSKLPTLEPSPAPSITPNPTVVPSLAPSRQPTLLPSAPPTRQPSLAPSHSPSLQPSQSPTIVPTPEPTPVPSLNPSPLPTATPLPSVLPSLLPSPQPTLEPSSLPTRTPLPSSPPTLSPSRQPTLHPSPLPLPVPSIPPSVQPSFSTIPIQAPTPAPTMGPTPLPTLAPHDARRLQERRQRRRLLTTTAEMVEDALIAMNSAIGGELVAGENKDFSSTHLGMRTTVVDSAYVALQGTAGLSVETATSSLSGLPSGVQPNMLLPSTINVSSGVTVAAINYGKFNPYELVGGELSAGASVNSFTLNGMEVSGLDDPIVLALPLPSSRRRLVQQERRLEGRRLAGTWNGTWGKKDFAASYSVNCGGANVSLLEATYTAQDLARAHFCGTEALLENETRLVNFLEPWTNASKHVWCNSTQEWHYLDCEGRVGIINYTCPVLYPSSTCTFWDTNRLTWSSEGCTYWRTDEENGVAYCNCTHLTSFTSDHTDELQESSSSLEQTLVRTTSLTGRDVRKNLGVLIFIVVIWSIGVIFYISDLLAWRLSLMNEYISDSGYRKFLAVKSAFRPATSEEQRHADVPFADQLRTVEMPVAGMLYSAAPDQEKAKEDIEFEARALMTRLKSKTTIYRNWIDKMYESHDIMALLNPSSYNRDIFAERTILLLFNLLSLLFLMCLFAPMDNMQGFVCPSDDAPDAGGAGLLPPLPSGLTFAGTLMWLSLKAAKVLTNLIWLMPPKYFLGQLLTTWKAIKTTKSMHEERLGEIKHKCRLLNPMELQDQEMICVTLNMLKSMEDILKRFTAVLTWRTTYLEWPEWRRSFLERKFNITIPSHQLLEDQWSDMLEFGKMIDQAIFEANSQLEYLDQEEAKDAQRKKEISTSSWNGWPKRRGAVRFGATRDLNTAANEVAEHDLAKGRSSAARKPVKLSSKALKQRWTAACEASLPHQVQLSVIRHTKILEAFDQSTMDRLPWWVPGLIRSSICAAKRFCCADIDPHLAQGALRPVDWLTLKRDRYLRLVVAYLALASLVVFMTGVRLDDNETSKMILFTTLISEATSKLMVQPLQFFFAAGLWPYLAVGMFIKDIHFFLGREVKTAVDIRRFDAREARPVDPNGPFELSDEWKQIESHSAFGGGLGGRGDDPSRAGQPGRRRRAGGVIVGGQAVGGGHHAWALFGELRRHNIETLTQLRDPSRVSREFLSGSIGLSDDQVGVMWSILHEIPVEVIEISKPSLFSRLKATVLGTSLNTRGKVMPVLPLAEESKEDVGNDGDEFVVEATSTIEDRDGDSDEASHGNDNSDTMLQEFVVGATSTIEDREGDSDEASHGNDNSDTMLQDDLRDWLDEVEPGFGDRFGHIFAVHGCTSVEGLTRLGGDQVRNLLESMQTEDPQMKLSSKRRLQASLRSPLSAKSGVADTAEPPAVKKVAFVRPAEFLSDSSNNETTNDDTNEGDGKEDIKIEEWLNKIKRGYGDRFLNLFSAQGCTHVSHLELLKQTQLEEIDDALRDIPGILMSTKRRLRGALRSHFEEIREARRRRMVLRRGVPESKGLPDDEDLNEDVYVEDEEDVANYDGEVVVEGGEEEGRPMEEWLDNIKRGYGERFVHLFKAHGCAHMSQMANLDEQQLEIIDDQLRNIPGILASTKRRIRGAIKDHWRQIGRVKEAADGNLDEEEEGEQQQQQQQQLTKDETTIEEWLDNTKRGYGKRFAHLFKAHGCDRVSQMANLNMQQLESIDESLRSIPEILMSTKRRIREAIKEHWKSIGRVAESKESDS